MTTKEKLTIHKSGGAWSGKKGQVYAPCQDLVDFAETICKLTGTDLDSWTFSGHPGTQGRELDCRLEAWGKWHNGCRVALDLKTGLFIVDHCKVFYTNAQGLVQWLSDPTGEPPEIEPKHRRPYKKGSVSVAAQKAIAALKTIAAS